MAVDFVTLNEQRWKEHVETQDATTIAPQAPAEAPTGGLVFFRGDTRDPVNGGLVKPWDRNGGEDGKGAWSSNVRDPPLYYRVDDQHLAHYSSKDEEHELSKLSTSQDRSQDMVLKTSGDSDCFALKPWSRHKYRIPHTSVVHREGDIPICCCFGGYKPTAAQVLWWCNLVCCVVHTVMVFVTLHYAYWRWGKSIYDTDRMLVRIYRLSSIPTAEMLSDNVTKAWDNTTRWSNNFYLYDNGVPVRAQSSLCTPRQYPLLLFLLRWQLNFATLVLSFFAISAGFHFCAPPQCCKWHRQYVVQR